MARPKQHEEHEYDVLAVAAARLRSRGRRQRRIADLLKVSQPEVCRLLSHAANKSYFDPNPRFIATRESLALWKEARRDLLRFPNIDTQLSRWAPKGIRCQARIVDAAGEEHFGRAVAEHIGTLIVDDPAVKIVGALWGKTLNFVGQGFTLQYAGRPPRRKNPIMFVPLCGEPLYQENLSNFTSSASSLAAAFAKAISGRPGPNDPSLSVPAYVSLSKYRDQQDGFQRDGGADPGGADRFAAIKQSIHDTPGHARIFGAGRLIDRLQAILTGVGVVHSKQDYTGTFLRERVTQGDTTKKELSQLVLGDIAGVLIPRVGLSKRDRDRVKELNEGLTGVQYGHFQAVARGGAPGVIVVASGRAKADLVRQLVKEGLVNVLIIDLELARALSKL